MPLEPIYRSSNGDDWLLSRNETTGAVSVIHRPNASSGGAETTMPAEEFLQRGGGGPEHQAVREALANTGG